MFKLPLISILDSFRPPGLFVWDAGSFFFSVFCSVLLAFFALLFFSWAIEIGRSPFPGRVPSFCDFTTFSASDLSLLAVRLSRFTDYTTSYIIYDYTNFFTDYTTSHIMKICDVYFKQEIPSTTYTSSFLEGDSVITATSSIFSSSCTFSSVNFFVISSLFSPPSSTISVKFSLSGWYFLKLGVLERDISQNHKGYYNMDFI